MKGLFAKLKGGPKAAPWSISAVSQNKWKEGSEKIVISV